MTSIAPEAPTVGATPTDVHSFEITAEEARELDELLSELTSRHTSSDDPEFLRSATVIAHQLPRRLRQHLVDFRLLEPGPGLCLINGYPLSDEGIGSTPEHWKFRGDSSPTLKEEIFLVLLGQILGECIGWSTQQAGYLVHDIFPIAGHEKEQLGSGSEELLTWHVEDAFHPARGDYIGLMCMRNPYGVATTVGHLHGADIDPEMAEILAQPRFTIRPDESHLPKNRSEFHEVSPAMARAYERIERMNTAPEKIPVLFGDPEAPYLRLDPYFMDPLVDDPEAQAALDYLESLLEERLFDLVLEAGQVIFIDNFKAVHGRRPFKARHDGTDRWLKRVNVTRDLRKSRDLRVAPESRIIC